MERSFRNLFGEKMEILHTKRQFLEKLQCQSDESETDMITDNQNGSRGGSRSLHKDCRILILFIPSLLLSLRFLCQDLLASVGWKHHNRDCMSQMQDMFYCHIVSRQHYHLS